MILVSCGYFLVEVFIVNVLVNDLIVIEVLNSRNEIFIGFFDLKVGDKVSK